MYSESSEPTWIQRVQKTARNSRNPLPTPSLISDGPPNSSHRESSPMQFDEQRHLHESPSLTHANSIIEGSSEPQTSPLDW